MVILWIVLALLILGLIFTAILWKTRGKKKYPTDYYAFYTIGLIWMIIGIPLENYALSIVGLVFAIIGLKNKDKWKKNRRTWKHLDNKEKKMTLFLMVFLGLILLLGIIFLILFEKGLII